MHIALGHCKSAWAGRGAVAGFVVLLLGILVGVASPSYAQDEKKKTWKSDWEVPEGFSISIDTAGYKFPTAIAFVPDPGQGPKDPLYFVTELRGEIKVVTNDRSVYTFAKDFFKLKPAQELPSYKGEVGMAGICLEPEHGYVFVSFAYQDDEGVLRNNIYRFQTQPRVFGLEPKAHLAFTDVFKPYASSLSHQIGPMVIHEGYLYVSVGDAELPYKSQDTNAFQGKILRMTLDGQPVADNPFYFEDPYEDEPVHEAEDYIWAYGLRNPFGLEVAQGRLFASDNGPGIDRFVEIQRGRNYGYDGTDWSIGTNAMVVFSPAVGPTQVSYLPRDSTIFPDEYRNMFYVALAGGPTYRPGLSPKGSKSVVHFSFDFENNQIGGRPKHFLRYIGPHKQLVPAATFGHDGLYVAPLLPVRGETGPILKIKYDPQNSHPFKVGRSHAKGSALLVSKGCYGCHGTVEGEGRVGPPLDRNILAERILKRLNSPEYIQSQEKVDQMDAEPFRSFQQARQEVRQAQGTEKVRLWIGHQLRDPKFDDPFSQMPNMHLKEEEISRLVKYLVIEKTFAERITKMFPTAGWRHVLIAFVVGILLPVGWRGVRRFVLPAKAH